MVKRHLSEIEHGQIVVMHQLGQTAKQLSEQFGVSIRTINRRIDSFSETGKYGRKRGSGRKRNTSARDDAYIIREVSKDPFVTGKELKKRLPTINLFERSIRRRISECSDLRSKYAAKKPLIREANRIKRLTWAKEHLHWTQEQWSKVLWSDESPFTLRFQGKRRVWRNSNKKYDPKYMIATVKHDVKINVWGCFAKNGVGALHLIDGIMDRFQYRQILEQSMIPSAIKLFRMQFDNFIMQEDNDPKHTSNDVQQWYRRNYINRMDWPSQSPDLNPIEHVWSYIERKTKDRCPSTKEQLYNTIKEAWKAIDPLFLQTLVESMPKRCQAVIDAHGYPTKY